MTKTYLARHRIRDANSIESYVRAAMVTTSSRRCPSDEIDFMNTLSPDGERYTGSRFRTDALDHRWPVTANSQTGKVDIRLRAVFDRAELHVANEQTTQLVQNDASNIIVVAQTTSERKLLVRCDVVAATCEIARDAGVPAAPVVTLARPVY